MNSFYVSIHELVLVFWGILVLVLLLIIVVLFYGFQQYKILNQKLKWSAVIDQKITDAIVYANEERISDEVFDRYSKINAFRNLFLEKLVATKSKFSGSAQTEIHRLFEQYDLKKEALKKLKQHKDYLIAGGIQELTAMDVSENIPQISAFLKHPLPQVYQEAQFSLVVFKGFEGLAFLNDFPHLISDWQQLRLLRSLHQIPENCTDSVPLWLQSENTSVVIFTLRLLRKFQMLSFYQNVKTLLSHPFPLIRIQAVRTLQSLENTETRDDLTQTFDEQPTEVQREIIKTLKNSNDKKCGEFFKNQLFNHSVSGIRILSAEALLNLGYEEDLREFSRSEGNSEELRRIIQHALQEKIC